MPDEGKEGSGSSDRSPPRGAGVARSEDVVVRVADAHSDAHSGPGGGHLGDAEHEPGPPHMDTEPLVNSDPANQHSPHGSAGASKNASSASRTRVLRRYWKHYAHSQVRFLWWQCSGQGLCVGLLWTAAVAGTVAALGALLATEPVGGPLTPLVGGVHIHRPVYHLLPAKNWMNDPNGPVYYKGYWHLFYQYNPYGPLWGNMHWGHFMSADGVHWTREPIALAPTNDGPDAAGVFSGCVVVPEGSDRPLAFYTGVVDNTGPGFKFVQTQCIAEADDEHLRAWTKDPGNPIIANEPPEFVQPPPGFRDPFIFSCPHAMPPWCMLLGSGVDPGGGMLMLYTAASLRGPWSYAGLYAQGWNTTTALPTDVYGVNWECPARLRNDDGNVAVLLSIDHIYTSHYLVGREQTTVPASMGGRTTESPVVFKPSAARTLDMGKYYAVTLAHVAGAADAAGCMPDRATSAANAGRDIMFGWSNEERSDALITGAGWAGVQGVPRESAIVHVNTTRAARALQSLRRGPSTSTKRSDDNSAKDGMWLRMVPWKEYEGLRGTRQWSLDRPLDPRATSVLPVSGLAERALDIHALFSIPLESIQDQAVESVGLRVLATNTSLAIPSRSGNGDAVQYTDIRVDLVNERLYVDRSQSSKTPGVVLSEVGGALPLSVCMAATPGSANASSQADPELRLDLHVLVDHSIVEVFACDGLFTLTARVYPDDGDAMHVGVVVGPGSSAGVFAGSNPHVGLSIWAMEAIFMDL